MTRISPEDRLDERLMCSVLRLEYDYATLTGTLWLVAGDCCHMPGAIGLFKGIDPRVEAIDTYSGEVRDTMYRRQGREWISKVPKN